MGVDSQFVSLLFSGPGCSSLGVGAFSENGPFRPSGEVLVKNQYSWNRGKLSANVDIQYEINSVLCIKKTVHNVLIFK